MITYKNGKEWATDLVKTAGNAASLELSADRTTIAADGKDLSFVTVRISDNDGITVPDAKNIVQFGISGPGEIIATDNGNPADLISFSSKERATLSGLALVIVRAKPNEPGVIKIKATSDGLAVAEITIKSK